MSEQNRKCLFCCYRYTATIKLKYCWNKNVDTEKSVKHHTINPNPCYRCIMFWDIIRNIQGFSDLSRKPFLMAVLIWTCQCVILLFWDTMVGHSKIPITYGKLIAYKATKKGEKTTTVTWNVYEINLRLRFTWDWNLIEVCVTQSRIVPTLSHWINTTKVSSTLPLRNDYQYFTYLITLKLIPEWNLHCH